LLRDDGAVVVRKNAFGGLTMFSEAFPNGVPVVYDHPAMPLEGPPPPMETLRDTAAEVSAKLRQAFAVAIRFDGDWGRAANDAGLRAQLFDTVRNTGGAFMILALDARDREAVARHVRRVRFAEASRSGVTRQRSILFVFYTLNQGLSGRASSYRLARDIRLVLK
jgi:hypothetical protein